MNAFLKLHETAIAGVISTFDRVIFKGHLTTMFPDGAFQRYLSRRGILLKDTGAFFETETKRIKQHAENEAARCGRPFIYLNSAHTHASGKSKEDMARSIAEKDNITEGLVCIFSVLEPCTSFQVQGNRTTHRLEVVRRQRKCLHLYWYLIDPDFGWMHIRIQTWAPYSMQVYINGREWLSRQLLAADIQYDKSDNKILWVADYDQTRRLCEDFAHTDWPAFLNRQARKVNPLLKDIADAGFGGYWWGIDQSEYASDILFNRREDLEHIHGDLVTAAMTGMGATDVMRFLGRKPHHAFTGEVVIDRKQRPQGCRIKFRLKRNAIKLYDHLNVLRVETTINNPSEFKVLKVSEETGEELPRWCPMRKGVSNFWRYAEVANAANSRLINALAEAPLQGEAIDRLDELCRSHEERGRKVSGFNPVTPETVELFQAVLSGEFLINGFRNRDLRNNLYPKPPDDKQEAKRRTHRVSRLIAKLRGHHLIAKVKNSRLYRVTRRGVQAMWAAVRFRHLDFPALSAIAETFA